MTFQIAVRHTCYKLDEDIGPAIKARLSLALLLLIACSLVSGCVVHRYDRQTGTEHLWGIGYMRARLAPPAEGLQVHATDTQLAGLSLETGRENYGAALGYHQTSRIFVSTNSAVRLEWYTRDLFHAQAGTNFPVQSANQNNLKATQ